MSPVPLLLLAAQALIWAAPAASAPPAPPSLLPPSSKALPHDAFTSGPVRPDARRLAELLMPEQLYLAALERAVWAGFDHSEADFKDMDPALLEALRTELAKVTRAHEQAAMPATYDRYARAFASHFTTSEVAQLVTFYATRAGQKMIVGKFAGIDVSGLLHKWIENPDADITAEDIQAINRNAASKVFDHLDKGDVSALLAFSQTPVFARLAAFGPTMSALETLIASEPDPELDAKMEAAVEQVMARFPSVPETT